jgi:hypothetical protein
MYQQQRAITIASKWRDGEVVSEEEGAEEREREREGNKEIKHALNVFM